MALSALQIRKNTVAKNDEKYPLCGIAQTPIKPAFDGCDTFIFEYQENGQNHSKNLLSDRFLPAITVSHTIFFS